MAFLWLQGVLLPDRLCFSSDPTMRDGLLTIPLNRSAHNACPLDPDAFFYSLRQTNHCGPFPRFLCSISVATDNDNAWQPMVHHHESSSALEQSVGRERGCIFSVTCDAKVNIGRLTLSLKAPFFPPPCYFKKKIL